jgi:Icc protein
VPQHKFSWFTDTHLNFGWPWTPLSFARQLGQENVDGLWLSGDISDGDHIIDHLCLLSDHCDFPIYFVMGNHDYYGRWIADVHDDVRKLCAERPNLIWLTESGPVTIAPGKALLGAEGWYDCQFGDRSLIPMTWDWYAIRDLRSREIWDDRFDMFRELAGNSARVIEAALENAIKNHDKVYILTHFPPFLECWGAPGILLDDLWKAYNVSWRVGLVIDEYARRYPNVQFRVLCGHTHTEKRVWVRPNLKVRVGRAKYHGRPGWERHILV